MLYESEHGPATDDEINLLEAGRNYGWPNVAGCRDDKAYVYANWSTPPLRSFFTVESNTEVKGIGSATMAPAGLKRSPSVKESENGDAFSGDTARGGGGNGRGAPGFGWRMGRFEAPSCTGTRRPASVGRN